MPRNPKFRKGENLSASKLNKLSASGDRNRPIMGSRMNGYSGKHGTVLTPKRGRRRASGYIPPFNPTVQNVEGSRDKTLTIGKGWFRVPVRNPYNDSPTPSVGTIPDRYLHPVKPVIDGTEIDDEETLGFLPALDLIAGDENIIAATVPYQIHFEVIGGTDYGSGTGAPVDVEVTTSGLGGSPAHTHGGIQPQAVVRLNQISYYLTNTTDIEIHVYNSASASGVTPPLDSDGDLIYELGRIELDADGNYDSSFPLWYVEENPQLFVPALIQSIPDSSSNPTA